jgi:hypothetical protein
MGSAIVDLSPNSSRIPAMLTCAGSPQDHHRTLHRIRRRWSCSSQSFAKMSETRSAVCNDSGRHCGDQGRMRESELRRARIVSHLNLDQERSRPLLAIQQ